MEKRQADRLKKRLPIKFGIDEPDHVGFIEDISATGLRIKTNNVFKPGTVLKLAIEDGESTLHAEGIVKWARKVPSGLIRATRCGMGITFLKIDANMVYYFEKIGIQQQGSG